MTSSHNSKDQNTTTYSSIPQQEEEPQQQQQHNDNGDRKERKEQERKEKVALLKADPHTVSIAMTDPRDDNNQDEYFSKTCRICGEGEEEEDQDDERQLYPEQTTIPSSSSSSSYSTEQQKILSNQQQRPKKFTFNNYDNPLIRPCKCKGTMMYVHIDCLNRWRELSPRQESYVACDLCGYQYNIYRPKFAAIVSHGYFLKSITLCMIVLLTIGMAYLCKWIHIYLILQQEQQPNNGDDDEEEEEEEGPMILGLNHIYLLCGLTSVSMFGIIYMIYGCTTQSSAVTNNDNNNGATSPLLPITSTSGWLCCCDNNSNITTLYGFYITDFTTCSGDAALGGIIVFIAFVIVATIVFGILNVFSGIYSLIESIVQHVAGRVKERILDVHDNSIITT